jgi:hypothetical protein
MENRPKCVVTLSLANLQRFAASNSAIVGLLAGSETLGTYGSLKSPACFCLCNPPKRGKPTWRAIFARRRFAVWAPEAGGGRVRFRPPLLGQAILYDACRARVGIVAKALPTSACRSRARARVEVCEKERERERGRARPHIHFAVLIRTLDSAKGLDSHSAEGWTPIVQRGDLMDSPKG